MSYTIILGDCLEELKKMPTNSVDLVLTSPPYESARTYGIDFSLQGQEWVDWAMERYLECVRVCRGIVAWVVEGQTRRFKWSATPALLMADLHRAGVKLRKPPVFHRVGIPGSGGPDWWRNDYETIICSSKGRLIWSDNTATGKPCKYGRGGDMSNRGQDGDRTSRVYTPPKVANPGNVIHLTVGGGKIGSRLAHKNEAPFPEKLAEAFIKSYCVPGGVVLDPFCGSGTTLSVAQRLDRDSIGIDIRKTQAILTAERMME